MTTRVDHAKGEALEACYEIRRRVFVEEQGVSREEEFDALDSVCIHFLARRDGEPVGTARLHVGPNSAKAQRVAVLDVARRAGIGRDLMLALEAEANAQGLDSVVLHAQLSALAFYEAIGYRAEGDVFMEADIPHRLMRKQLEAHSAHRSPATPGSPPARGRPRR